MYDKLEELIDTIVSQSEGAWSIRWTEEFEALDDEDKREVEESVYAIVGHCDGCGWVWSIESMEPNPITGEKYCWKCEDPNLEEDEEE